MSRPLNPYRPPSARQWRKDVAHCRALFPTDAPVRVRRRRLGEAAGTHSLWVDDEGTIVEHAITVDPRLQRDAAIDTLLHEWAHALEAERELPRSPPPRLSTLGSGDDTHDVDHPDSFWLTFGELYRAWIRSKRDA